MELGRVTRGWSSGSTLPCTFCPCFLGYLARALVWCSLLQRQSLLESGFFSQ
ncbi:hypothetical protein B0F90DRAFT_1758313, partial [Multifurca ochricompacta]